MIISQTIGVLPILALLNILLESSLCADCIYDPKRPETNCLMYCMVAYSSAFPNRRRYNTTSLNCEHMVECPGFAYYDYDTNCCYVDSTKAKKVEPVPEKKPDPTSTITFGNGTEYDFICVNGRFKYLQNLVREVTCQCNIFWKTSGRVMGTGAPLRCDMVDENYKKYFKNIVYLNGRPVMFDDLTSDQVLGLLSAAKRLEARQNFQRAADAEFSVMFLVQTLDQQPIIRSYEYPQMFATLLILTLMGALTIYEYWNLKIKVTRDQLQKRLEKILVKDQKS